MRYERVLSDYGVLSCIKLGHYLVDPVTAEVRWDRAFIRIYFRKRRKAIRVSRLVWMSVTGQMIPKGFEAHHEDDNRVHDSWSNLICLHKLDLRKLHHSDEEVPF